MKHLLLTTIAAVLLVGCGPSVDIHQAATEGNIEAVKQHLASGTDVNTEGGWRDTTPLHLAAVRDYKEIAELLITEGYETTGSWSNDILLFLLIQLVFIFAIYWSYSSIKTEIKDGWTVSGGGEPSRSITRIKKSDHPILFYITSFSPYVIFVITLSFIAIPSYGLLKTDIFRSSIRNDIEAVKQHLNDGTEVNAKNMFGETPLHRAAGRGQKEIVELLLAEGADVNAKTDSGRTPLDNAIKRNRPGFWGQRTVAERDETIKITDLLRKHGGKTAKELKAEGK